MHLINLFLQKRKMHENQHGLLMVATAYVLSALMLIMGSDMFYNINSLAAGVITETYEETQEVSKQQTAVSVQDVNLLLGQTKAEPIRPYGLTEAVGTGLGNLNLQPEVRPDASLWLLGCATSKEEFERLLETMSLEGSSTLSDRSEEVKNGETTEAGSDTGEKVVENKTASKSKSKRKKANSKKEIASLAANAVISVTEKEATMLERIVEAEATGEDMIGKILIANVIFNRVKAKEFPDTVEEVIFQNDNGDYQFSPVEDERYYSVKITGETKEAVQRALQGEDYSQGALYFISRKRANSSSAKWFDKNLDWLFKHGGHEFYK